MASFSDIVKEGTVKMKSSKSRQWKKSFIVLKKPSSKGRMRLEKYEDERSAIMGLESKVVELSDIKLIERLPNEVKRACISIVFINDTSRQFICETDEEASKWLMALTELYKKYGDKAGAKDCFNVYLLPNPAMSFTGECLIFVKTDRILLTHVDNEDEHIQYWHYGCLRKFSGDDSKFIFECGRRCRTGEGLFILNTKEGPMIRDGIQSAIRLLQDHERIMRLMNNNSQQPAVAAPPSSLTPSPSAPSGLSSPSRSLATSNNQLSTSPQLSPQHVPSTTPASRRGSDVPQRSAEKIDINRSASGEKIYLSTKDQQPPAPASRMNINGGRLCYEQSDQPQDEDHSAA